MAILSFNIAGATATHDISAEHSARLLEAMKTRMAQEGSWPTDGNGNVVEPTNNQVAQWVSDEYLITLLKQDTRDYEVERNKRQAADSTTDIETVKQ